MKDVIIESESNISIQALKESLIGIEDKFQFKTLEELQDYCYPFSKKLANGITEIDRIVLLKYIAEFYEQHTSYIAKLLGLGSLSESIVLNIMDSNYYLGFNSGNGLIGINMVLVCYNPIILNEIIIHELTHLEYFDHTKNFYNQMEFNVKKLGMQNELYGRGDNRRRTFPQSTLKWLNEIDDDIIKRIRKVLRGKRKNPNVKSNHIRRNRIGIQLSLNFIEPTN